MTGYTAAVATQLAELHAQFADKTVTAESDGDGGAYVTIEPIDPGPAYLERETWLGFQITKLCPDPDIYPVYLGTNLRRVDGEEHKAPITLGSWRNKPALQYSLRGVQHNPEVDTAALKATGVIACLAART